MPIVFPAGVVPSKLEVAALERTRLVNLDGSPATAFSSTTSPTDVDVDALIAQAVAATLNELPPATDQEFFPQIRHLATLYSAILIEGSYHREQIGSSSVALWHQLWMDGLTALKSQMAAGDRLGPQSASIAVSSPTRSSYQTAYDPADWVPPVPGA